MKKFLTLAVLIIASSGAVPACAGTAPLVGAITGGAVGGIIGNGLVRHGSGQVLATAAGVGLGATVGDAVGQSIDRPERLASADARPGLYSDAPSLEFTRAAPNYVAPPAPPPIYINQQAQTYCRPYSQMVAIQGRAYERYGTACLQPDGSWRIIQ